MNAYIARQPIFNRDRTVSAYELLYRDGNVGTANVVDGNAATTTVVADAVTLFGISNLTNGTKAYINFTRELLLSEFPMLLNPEEIVIELLEDIQIDFDIIERVKYLKSQKYTIALDDFTGNTEGMFLEILPYIDIIKVDFMLLDIKGREEVAEMFYNTSIILLAEKIETIEEFTWACKKGYQLFQGYFFSKPVTLERKAPNGMAAFYIEMLSLLQGKSDAEVNFDEIARRVYANADFTYRLMSIMNTTKYYRGFPIQSIKQALLRMGIDSLRRWCILLLARQTNNGKADEIIREAYIRAGFMKKLMMATGWTGNSEEGFLTGMFSLMDVIMETDMRHVLKGIKVSPEVEDALLGRGDNIISRFLKYIIYYEKGKKDEKGEQIRKQLGIRDGLDVDLYLYAVIEADEMFHSIYTADGMTYPQK